MKYIGTFWPSEDGWHFSFHDFFGIKRGEGKTLNEAKKNAQNWLRSTCKEAIAIGVPFPVATGVEDVRLYEAKAADRYGIELDPRTLWIEISA